MFLTEKFTSDTEYKLWNWGQHDCFNLKHEYKNPYTGEVKTYKLSKEEMNEFLNLSKEQANEFLKNFNK